MTVLIDTALSYNDVKRSVPTILEAESIYYSEEEKMLVVEHGDFSYVSPMRESEWSDIATDAFYSAQGNGGLFDLSGVFTFLLYPTDNVDDNVIELFDSALNILRYSA